MRPDHRNIEGGGLGLALDRQLDAAAQRAAQASHHLALTEPHRRDPVDLDDDVVVLKTRALGRGVFHDREDPDTLVDQADAHADPAEAVPARPVLTRLVAAGVAGETVQLAQHAVEDDLIDLFRFGAAHFRGTAAPDPERGRGELAPTLGVETVRSAEAARRPAVHRKRHPVPALRHRDVGVEARQVAQSRQSEIRRRHLVDVDVGDILVASAEQAFGERQVGLGGNPRVLRCAGHHEERDGNSAETPPDLPAPPRKPKSHLSSHSHDLSPHR